ncbi:hypothetical protein, partial [Enterococcus faecium]|uniref:hypothetical protein n=1 Tax=Enterococcus faecium TaxID=1352 RepID=UPI001C4E0097
STKKDQEELIHLISNYSKISLYQHHLTKSQKINHTKKQDNLLVRLSCFSKKTEYFSLKLVA